MSDLRAAGAAGSESMSSTEPFLPSAGSAGPRRRPVAPVRPRRSRGPSLERFARDYLKRPAPRAALAHVLPPGLAAAVRAGGRWRCIATREPHAAAPTRPAHRADRGARRDRGRLARRAPRTWWRRLTRRLRRRRTRRRWCCASTRPAAARCRRASINDEIRRLKAKHKKRVYAVVEEICASGAYYIAVAADEIYVDKASRWSARSAC